MRLSRSRRGYTLIEAVTVIGVMSVMLVSTTAMIIAAMRSSDRASKESYSSSDAVIAMQMIVNDVREAKSIHIIGGGSRLRIVFPKRTDDGYYDRHEADSAHQIDYYLSDSTGVPGQNGDWLWRGKDNDRKVVKRGVESLAFENDTVRSVKITVVTVQQSARGPERTTLTQRVVYLRNY